ncbi:MAG: hypothetical protein RL230_2785 [Pseudomonadota bacterium]|jgi:hypothetical protein
MECTEVKPKGKVSADNPDRNWRAGGRRPPKRRISSDRQSASNGNPWCIGDCPSFGRTWPFAEWQVLATNTVIDPPNLRVASDADIISRARHEVE